MLHALLLLTQATNFILTAQTIIIIGLAVNTVLWHHLIIPYREKAEIVHHYKMIGFNKIRNLPLILVRGATIAIDEIILRVLVGITGSNYTLEIGDQILNIHIAWLMR